jgi:hypothetical protein
LIDYEEILEHENYSKMNGFVSKESHREKDEMMYKYKLKLEKMKDCELNCSD